MSKRSLGIWMLLFMVLSAKINAQISLGNYALTGLTLIDANHTKPLERQTILVKGESILQIFPDDSKGIPDSFAVFRLKGKYIIPGLIDTHVHLATDPSGVDNRAHTLDVLSNMLYTGITSVRDMAGDARTLAGLSRDARTGDMPAPNIYFSALMAGSTFFSDPRTEATTKGGINGQMPYMKAISDSTDLRQAIAEAKGTGATGIKLYAELPAGLVMKIVQEATRQHMMVWSHAWLSPAKPHDCINAGIGSISHAPLLIYEKIDSVPSSWKKLIHPAKYWDDQASEYAPLIKLMKDHHTILDATLLTYKKWAAEDSTRICSYEMGKRLTAMAYKAGVKVCTGTDDDQQNFVQDEMKLLVTDAGFSPIDALIAATKISAEALGIGDQCGTVEVNKLADLVILDKNPIESIDHVKSVFMVIKGGKIFKR